MKYLKENKNPTLRGWASSLSNHFELRLELLPINMIIC